MYALVIYNPYSFAKYDLSTLATMLNATSNSSWSKPWEMRKMVDEIGMVCKLFDAGYYALAYNMLLHDIKPKLTGLKTDENGTRWGNGVFKNPWIVDLAMRLKLRGVLDSALADIKACQETTIHVTLGSLGNNIASIENLVNDQLSGSKKETCDRLISNATTLYWAMLSGFEQSKTVNCINIVRFQATIMRIDAIARNELIQEECSAIFNLLDNITCAEAQGFRMELFNFSHHHELSPITGIHQRNYPCCVNEYHAHKTRRALSANEWRNSILAMTTSGEGSFKNQ